MTPAQRKAAALSLATALAIPAEGLRRVAYYDPPGILTVCRGHTGPDVVKDKIYSLAACDQYMDNDMRKAVDTVEKCAPGLPPNVLAAFADAVYNSGPKIACGPAPKSTAYRYLKNGQLIEACNQIPRWNKASVGGIMIPLPGLTKRRAEEQTICLQGLT